VIPAAIRRIGEQVTVSIIAAGIPALAELVYARVSSSFCTTDLARLHCVSQWRRCHAQMGGTAMLSLSTRANYPSLITAIPYKSSRRRD
jgi:hypothetical protein